MLSNVIKEKLIQSNGKIPFEEFMSLCLYTPGLGYYSGNNTVIGEQGDFVTAPEISSLFGDCIANQIADVYQNEYDILEFGAGTGKLALDVLTRLQTLNALPDHYYILEVSGNLRARQQTLLQTKPELFERCVWLDSLLEMPINGVVLANEVLDAMPATLFRIADNAQVEKAFVIEDANNPNSFMCQWQEADEALKKEVKALGPLPVGYQSEINQACGPWLKSIYESLQQGLVLLIDYGFEASTYYHPDRSSGTLMCHHQHKAHPDPFKHLGEQDITVHVDFSKVANDAYDLGFSVAGFSHQAAFLIANGLTEGLQDLSGKEQRLATQAVKTLTMPHEMGELFKVMALTKAIDMPLKGFQMMDRRRVL